MDSHFRSSSSFKLEEDRRQSFTNEKNAAIEAKRIKAAADESEFETKGWRRAGDKASATKMAAREVNRTEHVLKIRAEEETVNAREKSTSKTLSQTALTSRSP